MGFTTVLAFGAGIFLLWLICKILTIPLKIIWRLLINAVIGAVLLIIFNLVGGIFGLTIMITPLSALIAGIFGIPGVIVLLLITLL